MAKISVVVPVYQAEGYICELIESLQHQTMKDLEIILVDDGSPDKSGKICDEFAKTDSRIHVIHKKNGGVGAARNDGLKIATGQWLYFCDADDYLELDALEKLVTTGEQTDSDVVFGDINMITSKKIKHLQFHKQAFVTDDRTVIEQIAMTVLGRNYCYMAPQSGPAPCCYGGPWNKIVRHSILKRENFQFDLSVKGICDDLLYSYFIFASAHRVAYVPVTIYNYRLINNSITHTYKPNILDINNAIFSAWETYMEYFGTKDHSRNAYNVFVIRRLKATLGLYFFNEKNKKSLKEQYAEINGLICSEPYYSAVKNVEMNMLQNNYDKLLWLAAKIQASSLIHFVYELSVVAKKVK